MHNQEQPPAAFLQLVNLPSLYADSGKDFRIGNDVLYHLLRTCDASMTTLETGAGFTTAVMAMVGCRHTVIAPGVQQFAFIKQWCIENVGHHDMITFINGVSQDVLPKMELPLLDLVIIDGAHEFPLPILDFFYTAPRIKVGGRLVIDDTNIPAVGVLVRFLLEEEKAGRWKATHGTDKTVIFERLTDFDRVQWFDQPFNVPAVAKKQ